MQSFAQYNISTPLLDYAWPRDQDIAATPWADIYDNPADYYNTDQFPLPARLQSPDIMSVTDVLILAQFLASHTFLFHTKADILGKRQTRKAEEETQNLEEEEVEPPLKVPVYGSPQAQTQNLDEEEVEPPPESPASGSPGAQPDGQVEGTDAKNEPPLHQTSSRKKRSTPDNDDEPVRKSKRLKKDSARVLEAKAMTVLKNSEAGNKV